MRIDAAEGQSMINDEYKRMAAEGLLAQGRVRGVILGCTPGDGDDFRGDRLFLRVTGSDVAGVVPGQEVTVEMSQPKDDNLFLRDLQVGFGGYGFDPVPVGSEVTFENCSLTEGGRVDVTAYDIATIKRAEPEAPKVRYPDIAVDLIGVDTNAFAVMGAVSRALKRASVDKSEIDAFRKEAMSGSYDDLLATAMRWVAIEGAPERDLEADEEYEAPAPGR